MRAGVQHRWLCAVAIAAAALAPSAHADNCAAASTTKAMQQCAYDEFLSAQAVYAQRYRSLAA